MFGLAVPLVAATAVLFTLTVWAHRDTIRLRRLERLERRRELDARLRVEEHLYRQGLL